MSAHPRSARVAELRARLAELREQANAVELELHRAWSLPYTRVVDALERRKKLRRSIGTVKGLITREKHKTEKKAEPCSA